MLIYHHSASLDAVVFGELRANRQYSDPDFKESYSWLEREIGFYPVFLAVGITEDDIRMTGYQNQWRRILSINPSGKEYRKRGEFPNEVLFSFENVDGLFIDYDYWHIVLNAGYKNYQMTDYEKRLIFKPSWPTSKWLRKAKKVPHSVQLVTPTLYLPDAQRVYVRNKSTKKLLESKGFHNVKVKRIPADSYPRLN